MRFRALCALPATGLVLVFACTGSVGGINGKAGGDGSGGDDSSDDDTGQGGDGDGGGDQGGAGGPIETACREPSPGPIPIRRLTERQFANSVKDLFAFTTAMATDFPVTSIRKGYRTYGEANTVTADGAEDISSAAATVAARATTNVNTTLGCTPGTAADDACVKGYVRKLARRAYRRPANDDELAALDRVYSQMRASNFTPGESVAAVIETVLQSPQFLYLSETGQDPEATAGSIQALTAHEIAARLSYGLWDTLPDPELEKAADDGALSSSDQVEQQARRLLADRRAEPLIAQFIEDWLELFRMTGQTKDAQKFPEWNAALAQAIKTEITTFATEVAFRGDKSFATLMSAPFTMANNATAGLYNAPRPAANAGFVKVELNPSQRAGVLTSSAFLTAHAGTQEGLLVVRGAAVRRNFLCQEIELPPGLMVTSPAPDPNLTARERFKEHSSEVECAGCHSLMDPIGFGLEGYDALGRIRTKEPNGADVDVSGSLDRAGDASGPFAGGVELSQKLAASNTGRDCLARQLFSFMAARPFSEQADRCALHFIEKRFAESQGDLQELVVAIAVSDTFLYRRMPERGQ
jgi:hypothetical protein